MYSMECSRPSIAQTLIQLVLLPALMVGQNLQNQASDVRAAKQFEDTEFIMNQVNEHTDGGFKIILDRLSAVEARLTKDESPTPTKKAAPRKR
jgi:hypothetical protein